MMKYVPYQRFSWATWIMSAIVGGIAMMGEESATLRAGEGQSVVWELKPYRISVLLVADWSPEWSMPKLAQCGRFIEERSTVEIGRPWQLSVTAAPYGLRQVFLAASSPGEILPDNPLLASYRASDKVIVIFLRMARGMSALEAWELDWTSKQWSVGPSRQGGPQADVRETAFEMCAQAVSPLAVVKQVSGSHIVLRQRADLLPARNVRRRDILEREVYELMPRARSGSDGVSGGRVLLVVETRDESGLVCREMSQGRSAWESAHLDTWIAVGVRPSHSHTVFRLLLDDGDDEQPSAKSVLTHCDVWRADQFDATGAFAGRVSRQGEVRLSSRGHVEWFKVHVGGIPLFACPVLVGAHEVQTIRSDLSEKTLQEASLLSICRTDVAELVALHDLYRVRYERRGAAGLEAEATELPSEIREDVRRRARALSETMRNRRSEHGSGDDRSDQRFGPYWAELSETLNQLEAPGSEDEEEVKSPVEDGGDGAP